MGNPYSAPNRDHAPPPAAASELPPEGRYQLEPSDSAAAVRARLGTAGMVFALLLVVMVIGWNVMQDVELSRMFPAIVLVVIFAGIFGLGPILARRAVERLPPEQRRIRIAFTNEHISIADEAGSDSRAVWSSFKGRRFISDRLFLELANGTSYVLPRRAWGADEDFARVRAFVEARVPEVKRSKFGLYVLIMWVVLIAFFVAVWSFFSDVPPHR